MRRKVWSPFLPFACPAHSFLPDCYRSTAALGGRSKTCRHRVTLRNRTADARLGSLGAWGWLDPGFWGIEVAYKKTCSYRCLEPRWQRACLEGSSGSCKTWSRQTTAMQFTWKMWATVVKFGISAACRLCDSRLSFRWWPFVSLGKCSHWLHESSTNWRLWLLSGPRSPLDRKSVV